MTAMNTQSMLRRWLPRLLPSLQQGSTLTIRSHEVAVDVSIKPKWREDGLLSFVRQEHGNPVTNPRVGLRIYQGTDKMTSMGREQSQIFVEVVRETNDEKKGNSLQPEQSALVSFEEISSGFDPAILSTGAFLTLEVPEKLNIECDLGKGGSISIHDKIEGDVQIKTANGNIKVKKLRGHTIDVQATGPGNTIYSSELIEAETFILKIPSSGRFRAKRIHANSCDVCIGDESKQPHENESPIFDSDDGGAVCDISALYITGDARINVRSSDVRRQAVRVKSSHGHVTVHATGNLPVAHAPHANKPLPMAELGGVNGSCEVFASETSHRPEFSNQVSCRVHFDSIEPGSVSVVKADCGNVHVTFDRKVETDLRMLSCSDPASVDVDKLVLDHDDQDFDDAISLLEDLEITLRPSAATSISVNTKAFTNSRTAGIPYPLKNISFIEGWLENNSAEPDSRFDRRLRGETGSTGKIRLEGASKQALDSFTGSGQSSGSSFVRPLVAVVGPGGIVIETLSWIGNIARRYGLDEKRDPASLGRTATRRGRPLDSSPE